MRPSIAAAVALFAVANADNSTTTGATAAAAVARPACRNLPGDPGWPSAASWAALNKTLSGRLIATVPLGTPCHDPKYNQNVCANLQADWELPQTHYVTSSSIMQPFFANQSCDAFTPESQPCLLGNYVSYAVNVSCTADVSAALAFATKNNIRVVVRNTGHDFFGRSTGAGALGIWTHNLKNVSVSNWSSKNYTGPAITVGAGIQGFEILEAAHAQGLVAITGECPTVGVAGGFTQGGGHSALSTQFGLGADQTLEFEVVTAAGTVLTASPSQNSDLYWALSGGGPGYGVVTSMTVKAHPETTVGGAQIDIYAATTTPELFNQVISEFYAMIPTMIDQGAMVVYLMNNQILEVKPITVWNSTGDYIENTVLAPFTALLTKLGVPSTIKYTTLSYFDHYATYMGPLPYGSLDIGDFNYGSRLIPRSVLVNNNNALQAVIQNLTAQGVVMAGSSANYARPAGVYNSVLPAWRNTSIHLQIGTAWNNTPSAWPQMIADQNTITNVYMPQLEAVTPGSGIYMNEGDFQQPNFQQEFFGSNYNALLAIKNKYDPNALFWGNRLVGSESWTVASNGRMCRA